MVAVTCTCKARVHSSIRCSAISIIVNVHVTYYAQVLSVRGFTHLILGSALRGEYSHYLLFTANRSTQLQVVQQGRNPSSLAPSLGSQLPFSSQACLLTSVRCHPQISTIPFGLPAHLTVLTSAIPHHSLQVPSCSQHSCLCSCYWLCLECPFSSSSPRKLLIHPQSPFSVICSVTHVLFPS